MAKATPILGSLWTDRDTRSMSPHAKLVTIFFMTWDAPGSGVSGIYKAMLEDVAHYTGISLREVRRVITNGLHNISYDFDHDSVFVKNKLRYRIGGRPDLIEKSIAADYKITGRAVVLWCEFKEHYRAFVDRSPALSQLFEGLMGCNRLNETPATVIQPEPGATITAPLKVEGDIERMLSSYTEQLETDDADQVLQVYKYLTTNLRTGMPIAAKRQREILAKWSKEPALKIGVAARQFISGGCMDAGKRANYFWGIVRGSATSWMIEYQNEKDKGGMTLE